MIEGWILNLFLIYNGRPLVPHPPEFATHAVCLEAGREMSEGWHAIGWPTRPKFICIYKGGRPPVVPLR